MSEVRKVESPKENQELKRGIKGWQVTFIGFGGVIGSCYFLGLGLCVGEMGPAVLIAFGVVGVIVQAWVGHSGLTGYAMYLQRPLRLLRFLQYLTGSKSPVFYVACCLWNLGRALGK